MHVIGLNLIGWNSSTPKRVSMCFIVLKTMPTQFHQDETYLSCFIINSMSCQHFSLCDNSFNVHETVMKPPLGWSTVHNLLIIYQCTIMTAAHNNIYQLVGDSFMGRGTLRFESSRHHALFSIFWVRLLDFWFLSCGRAKPRALRCPVFFQASEAEKSCRVRASLHLGLMMRWLRCEDPYTFSFSNWRSFNFLDLKFDCPFY